MHVTPDPGTPAIDVVVTREDCLLDNFRNITEERRFELETKKRKLLSNQKNITLAPGDDDMSFLVATESSEAIYHHVTSEGECDVCSFHSICQVGNVADVWVVRNLTNIFTMR